MAKGRTTIDPKGDSIRVRVNDDMRILLEKESLRSGKSVSQITREALAEYFRKR